MKILFIPLHIIRYVQNTFNMKVAVIFRKVKNVNRIYFQFNVQRTQNDPNESNSAINKVKVLLP